MTEPLLTRAVFRAAIFTRDDRPTVVLCSAAVAPPPIRDRARWPARGARTHPRSEGGPGFGKPGLA